jgi:L-aminopeptidase/D-esterase-like protein
MKWLDERNIGYPVGAAGVVPIVPAAILFDLGFGGSAKIRPGADCGYRAADAASEGPVQEGNVGAGAGATVGKSGGGRGGAGGGPMKAGIGSAALKLPNGLVVAAIVAVNAVGDIVDPWTGQVVAGARGADGKLLDARILVRGGGNREGRAGENTTIGLVATNAKLTKVQAQKMAQMAHDGYARAISPVHTPGDGDTIFSAATGTWDGQVNYGQIGSLAAEAMADAIVRAATQAASSNNLPAARDLGTIPARFMKK